MFFSCRTTGENFRSLPKFFKKNEREPLCRGDRCYAIVYDKNFSESEAREGAVVTYQLPAGTLVTHRIISVDKEEQTVVTQGDANNIADTAPVAWQQIVGVYAFHIPYLGYISIYAKTPLGIAVVCGVLIVLILLNFIPDILEEDKKKISDTE